MYLEQDYAGSKHDKGKCGFAARDRGPGRERPPCSIGRNREHGAEHCSAFHRYVGQKHRITLSDQKTAVAAPNALPTYAMDDGSSASDKSNDAPEQAAI